MPVPTGDGVAHSTEGVGGSVGGPVGGGENVESLPLEGETLLVDLWVGVKEGEEEREGGDE